MPSQPGGLGATESTELFPGNDSPSGEGPEILPSVISSPQDLQSNLFLFFPLEKEQQQEKPLIALFGITEFQLVWKVIRFLHGKCYSLKKP